MKIAFISGTSILKSRMFDDWSREEVSTGYGLVSFRRRDDFILINRHGREGLTPPHAINHKANIKAISDLGFANVISLTSVGSLKEAIVPGSFVSCSDYFCLQPSTFSDEIGNYEAPFVANNLIERICRESGMEIEPGKVYVQMVGPRFETPAEVRVIRDWGDVVGMNMASEADLAREIGIRYNSLCMVDNYANGICGEPISGERFKAMVEANQEKVNRLFATIISIFG